ncbi:MAG: tripartite tricarboxylate transporter substrate binding protein [Hydrogenophaga sp.]|nr:tripartite tricarboxylate transporter substrate binding protein [Hydrogenophaga sp.]
MKPISLTLRGLAAAALTLPLLAHAAYPEKIITLVVPYPPGGATDTIARKLMEPLGKRLGQNVIVENRPGAGTAIGATLVAKAPADGYTLLISSNTTFTVNAAIKRQLPYDPQKGFESIGTIGSSPLVLLANPKVAASNLPELLALAKRESSGLNFGSFGNGTTAHLAGEMLKVMAGANLVHVAYKGSAPAMTDLIGGQIPLTFDTNVAAMPQMAAGKVKALAVTSKKRSPQMPTVPTIAEAGFPDYEMVPWIAIVAPRGLPEPVRAALGKALADTVKDPSTRAELEKIGVEVAYEPGSAYDTRVARELPLLRAYVHKANIPLE